MTEKEILEFNRELFQIAQRVRSAGGSLVSYLEWYGGSLAMFHLSNAPREALRVANFVDGLDVTQPTPPLQKSSTCAVRALAEAL